MRHALTRQAIAAAALAVLVVAGACSSPQGTEPENSLLGKDGKGSKQSGRGAGKPNASATAKGPGRKGPPSAVTPPAGGPGLAAPTAGEAASKNSGAAKTETEVTSSGTDPRRASVLVTEPDPDAEKSGLPPDFADIVSVRVQGIGRGFRVTITFRGDIPSSMPDDKTYMVAGFGLTGRDGQNGYAFGASADTDGWNPYGGDKDEGGEFPGTMSIDGATMVFTMPWSAVGGVRPFQWYAQETWFKSLAGTTHYSLDNVPNDGPAKYPAG